MMQGAHLIWQEGVLMHGWGLFFWMAALSIAATVVMFKASFQKRRKAARRAPGNAEQASAMERLRERYSRGDVGEETFLQRRREILNIGAAPSS